MPEGTVLAALITAIVVVLGGIGRYVVRGRSERTERLDKRFTFIYAPLRALLLDTHIAVYSGVTRPYFRQRLRHSWKSIWRLPPHPRRAVLDLFDKRISSSTGIEYGSFPLSEIDKIVVANVEFADRELVELIHWLRREHEELPHFEGDYNPEDISDPQLQLRDRILGEYDRLARRFVP